MMNMMQEKGIDMFEMMQMICPKCVSVATSQASGTDKKKAQRDYEFRLLRDLGGRDTDGKTGIK